MKKYQKSFLLIVVGVILIPQIALASWWNPLSWFGSWGFGKVDTKTQVLENRIAELEKKLDDTTASTTATTTPNIFNVTKATTQVETGMAVKPKTTTTPNTQATKPIPVAQDNQTQTDQYKKIIINKIAEIYAVASSIPSYIDKVTPSIDSRIDVLNSTIEKNKTSAANAPDTFSRDFALGMNEMYKGDNGLSELQKTSQNHIKDLIKGMMESLNAEAATIYQMTSISATEFEKLSTHYDEALKKMNGNFQDQEKSYSDYLAYTKKENDDYKYALDLFKAKIYSASTNSNYIAPQINYTSVQPVIPVIVPPRIQTCYFSSQTSRSQTTGNMTCY